MRRSWHGDRACMQAQLAGAGAGRRRGACMGPLPSSADPSLDAMAQAGECSEAQCFLQDAETCDFLSADPTLQSCCARDLEEQATVSRLKAQLSIHDRSKERLRAAGRVIGGAPPPPPPPAGLQQVDSSDLESEDDAVAGEPGLISLDVAATCSADEPVTTRAQPAKPGAPPTCARTAHSMRAATPRHPSLHLQSTCVRSACWSCSGRRSTAPSCSRRGLVACQTWPRRGC